MHIVQNTINDTLGGLPLDALVRRFDISGPRYTSYPTADRFIEAYTRSAVRLFIFSLIILFR